MATVYFSNFNCGAVRLKNSWESRLQRLANYLKESIFFSTFSFSLYKLFQISASFFVLRHCFPLWQEKGGIQIFWKTWAPSVANSVSFLNTFLQVEFFIKRFGIDTWLLKNIKIFLFAFKIAFIDKRLGGWITLSEC